MLDQVRIWTLSTCQFEKSSALAYPINPMSDVKIQIHNKGGIFVVISGFDCRPRTKVETGGGGNCLKNRQEELTLSTDHFRSLTLASITNRPDSVYFLKAVLACSVAMVYWLTCKSFIYRVKHLS